MKTLLLGMNGREGGFQKRTNGNMQQEEGKPTRFTWGNNETRHATMVNTWEGECPSENIKEDGFGSLAPIKSCPTNLHNPYDKAGNIWEWAGD